MPHKMLVIASETPNTTPAPLACCPPPDAPLMAVSHSLVAHLPQGGVAFNHNLLCSTHVSVPQVLRQWLVRPLLLERGAGTAPPATQQGFGLGQGGGGGVPNAVDDCLLDKSQLLLQPL